MPVPTTTELKAAARNRTEISSVEELCNAGVDPAIFDLGFCALEADITQNTLIDRSSDRSSNRLRRVIDPNGPFAANKKTVPPPLRPTPNHLSNFQSWTYKFNFYIAKLDALTGNPKLTEKIILASSGETNLFTLRNVQIESIIAPGWKAKNFLPTTHEFELFEPRGGALFYEAIFEAANILSIENYINAPFYLELSWVGYDENGVPIVIEDDEVRSKIWALKIVDIRSSLSSEGSLYTIKCIEFEHWMSANKFAILNNHLSIEADTVGKFFDGLKVEINKTEDRKDGSGFWRLFPDTFDFNIDPDIRNIKLKESNPNESPQRQNSLTVMRGDVTRVHVPRGYEINEIVNDLMVASEEWVTSAMTDGSDPNVRKAEPDQRVKKNKRIWVVTANVKIGKYDAAVNDYSKDITYNIGIYRTTRANIDPGTLNKSDEDIKRNDQQLLEERSIGKLYEYLYTGKNIEVLNLDIEFNMMWTTNLPLYAGLQQVRSLDDGRVVSNQPQDQKSLAAAYQKVNNKFEALNQFLPGERSGLQTSLEIKEAALVKQLDKFREQREQRQLVNNEILEQISKDKEKLFASTLIEDLGKIEGFKPSPTPIPVTFTADGERPETQFRGIVEGSYRPFRSIASTILNNIFYTPTELMQIELEIRGDPSWLGISSVEKRLRGKLFDPITVEDTMADRMGREDTLFIIEMKLSRFENKETGLIDFKDNEQESEIIISGVYQATNVISRFNEGVFTQVVRAIKDVEITRLRNLERLKINL